MRLLLIVMENTCFVQNDAGFTSAHFVCCWGTGEGGGTRMGGGGHLNVFTPINVIKAPG